MKKDSLREITEALDGGGARFLVAGGLAVNAHGLLRFTADVDIVVQLVPENSRRAFAALTSIGFLPFVPVNADGFADAQTRNGWIRDKGMRVRQFRSDDHRTVTVDVFVAEQFQFDEEYDRALKKELIGGTVVRFVSLDTLLRINAEAGRAIWRTSRNSSSG